MVSFLDGILGVSSGSFGVLEVDVATLVRGQGTGSCDAP